MDLSEFDLAPEGAWCSFTNPKVGGPLTDSDKTPVRMRAVGQDHDRFRAAQSQVADRRRQEAQRRGGVPISAKQLNEDECKILGACVLEFQGISVDGSQLDCSPENAAMIFMRFPFMKDQFDEFCGLRKNFFKA